MKVQRFHGATIALAYGEVRATLGEDAVIVTTETMPQRGGGSIVEVVAGLPDGVAPRPGLANDAAAHDLVRALAEASATAPVPSAPSAPFVNPHAGIGLPRLAPPPQPSTWEELAALEAGQTLEEARVLADFDDFDDADEADVPRALIAPELAAAVAAAAEAGDQHLLGTIAERMRSVEETLQRMAHQRANELAEHAPLALQDVRQQLIDHGVGARVLVPLIEKLAGSVRPTTTQREVARAAERAIAALLPPTPHLDASLGLGRGPLMVFIVGPHGAGKTSLAIKLAHDFAQARTGRVLLAGTDIGRAGSPQQLLAAAAAAQVEARLCYTPGELRALVRDETPSVVIVDTPAQGVGRRDQMLELTAFAQASPRRATLLALPAWTAATDAVRTTLMYAPLGLTGIVATHVDQASSFGGIATAAVETTTGIAYATSSDGLTDGLAVGDNHALALALLTGSWPRLAAAQPEGALSGSRA
jgi:flagellar biosynthesis GTPase FlhF